MILSVLMACEPAPTAPLALVYRGPAGCAGCSSAVADLLEGNNPAFDVTFVGPDDEELTEELLATATVYAQPGGEGTVADAFAFVKSTGGMIRDFVDGGGRYLGFCMGGYFAGFDPGFEMLPGDSGQYIASEGADVTTEIDTVVPVLWGEESRSLYFQDGPYFELDDSEAGAAAEVLATYEATGAIAALVAPYGEGKLGVVGPHPEATEDWYTAESVSDPDGVDTDLGRELVAATLE